MPLYDARKDREGTRHLLVKTPEGEVIGNACACDTDRCWIEVWELETEHARADGSVVKLDRPRLKREPARVVDGKWLAPLCPPVRKRVPYDVYDRRTGELLHLVRPL